MPPLFHPSYSGLLTDLYELTMAAGYIQNRFQACATFELFVRSLPRYRNYLVAAGLDQALEFLEHVRFSEEEISYLRDLPLFRHVRSEFFEFLAGFHFSGDVWALPEGTIFFPGEPILRVTAPIAEAQLVETSLLSAIHLQTLVASKAARVSTAAAGRPVIEFGSRRAHGIEAGVLAARAAYIGGCAGTSNTYAGYRFGIPIYGTQAHSWIMAYEREAEAFSNFLDVFPERSTLLVDTYDVRGAIEKIIAMGRKPGGIRLDSGDILADSVWAREKLDAAGWNEVRIFASGDLTEERIEELLQRGARIDSFGVGTALSSSADSPSVGVIYKLVEVQFADHIRETAKFSEEKNTYPGRKQVFRFCRDNGAFSADVIGCEDEVFPGAEPLLVPMMREGRRLAVARQDPIADTQSAQSRFLAGRRRLPAYLQSLSQAAPSFPVSYSAYLQQISDQLRDAFLAASPAHATVFSEKPVLRHVVFWEVDVQRDFMQPDGKLYVPNAENILPNINRLVEAARQGRVFLLSSADAHKLDDPELREWPPHCLKGTTGAELLPEACADNRTVVPNELGFSLPRNLFRFQQVVVEKNSLDVFDNPNTDVLLEHLKCTGLLPAIESTEFVVFGVATEYCVRCTVEGLLRRGFRVSLATDAIQSLDPAKGEQMLADSHSRGVKLLTTNQALSLLAPSLARSA